MSFRVLIHTTRQVTTCLREVAVIEFGLKWQRIENFARPRRTFGMAKSHATQPHSSMLYSMRHTPSKRRTDGRTDKETRLRPSVCSFVRSFISVSVLSVRGIHPMGERTATLNRNLRGRGKNPGSINKCSKFIQLISRKPLKLLPKCHHISHF